MSRIMGYTQQLGLVVRDLDSALADWTERLGIGPFFVFREKTVENYRYRGKSAQAPVLSLAFGYSGNLQIELIQQHNSAPSGYLDFLASGREGVQHISSFEDRLGYDAVHARAIASGMDPLHEGAIATLRFAYFDSHGGPGSIICEVSEAGMDGPRQLYEEMRIAAQNWDGTDPVRTVEF